MKKEPIVYDQESNKHSPLVAGDTLVPSSIPVDNRPYNAIEVSADGLYVSTEAPVLYAEQYVDAINGDDGTGEGTFARPYRTVNRAIDNMIPGVGGYVVYLYEGQEHVLPARVVQGISMKFTSYPSLQMQRPLMERIAAAWFDEYNEVIAPQEFVVYNSATMVPDRSSINYVLPRGPYGDMYGLVSIGGTVEFECVRVVTGETKVDTEVEDMLRAAMLYDYPSPGPVTYKITYSEIILGGLPLVVQNEQGSTLVLDVHASLIAETEDPEEAPVYIEGSLDDAQHITAIVSGENWNTQTVTVDGQAYSRRLTVGSGKLAKDCTVKIMESSQGIPLTIHAAFLSR